jgi:hypothetical protein
MTDTASNFPSGAPVDSKGSLTPQWRQFFLTLFNRTGGTGGNDSAALLALIEGLQKALDDLAAEINGDVLALEPTVFPSVDIGAQLSVLGISVEQAFAAIAAIQQAIPAYGEAFSATGIPQTFPDVVGEPRMAALALTDVPTDMVFSPQSAGGGAAQSPYAATPGASPFKYTATFRQALHITGGTISAISYSRGASSFPVGIVTGGQLVELSAGDAVTITYSVGPTLTVIPR